MRSKACARAPSSSSDSIGSAWVRSPEAMRSARRRRRSVVSPTSRARWCAVARPSPAAPRASSANRTWARVRSPVSAERSTTATSACRSSPSRGCQAKACSDWRPRLVWRGRELALGDPGALGGGERVGRALDHAPVADVHDEELRADPGAGDRRERRRACGRRGRPRARPCAAGSPAGCASRRPRSAGARGRPRAAPRAPPRRAGCPSRTAGALRRSPAV